MRRGAVFAAVAMASAGAALAAAAPASAQANKDTIVIGMGLEPPGLDPTSGAASAIAEITDYNIYEQLTRVNSDGSVTPLLSPSWTVSPDQKTYTFKLLTGVKYSNGEPFDSADVKFSFDRAAAASSTNKDKSFFQSIVGIATPDPATVVITFENPSSDSLFRLGLPEAAIVEPKSAATDATQPVGTGPYTLQNWNKGSSATLVARDGYRAPASIHIKKATFRFISDSAQQVAALLAGDIDAFPRFAGLQSIGQFKNDPRFSVTVGGTEGKTILSINNARKPFDDVRVRRAISYAIDRKSIIDGAENGYGTPIGSHYTPLDEGYIDLTGMYPYDPAKARELLKEAGVQTPLDVTLTLPPPTYARLGGQIIAAELADVGIDAKIENVQFAQWLSGAFKGNFDLTIISHVEPLDLATVYGDPNYYIHYDSQSFRDLLAKIAAAPDKPTKIGLLQDAQRQLATDAVNGFLFQLPMVNVANAHVKGLWTSAPVFTNDLAAIYWN